MTTPMREGDPVAVTVTKVLQFGLLVQSAEGVAGLVRAVHAEVGAVIDVQVREFDGRRFAATAE